MARAERRRPVRNERRWSWWWLALPALGIAGYAAFSATLALLGDDGTRTPSGSARDAEQRLPMAAPTASAATAPADVVPAPAAPADAAPVAEAVPAVAPSILPSPTSTAAPTRAAAARKVKPKRVPKEHLTEQDRRALDALVEQAGKNPR